MKKILALIIVSVLLCSCVKQEVAENSKTTVSEASVTTKEVTTNETTTSQTTTTTQTTTIPYISYTDTDITTTEEPQRQKYKLVGSPEELKKEIDKYISASEEQLGDRTIKEITNAIISDFNYTQEGKTDEQIIKNLLDQNAVCFLAYHSGFYQETGMFAEDAFKTYQNFEKLMYATFTKDYAKELLEKGRSYDDQGTKVYSGSFFFDDNRKFGVKKEPVNFGYLWFRPYMRGYDFKIDNISENTCDVTLYLTGATMIAFNEYYKYVDFTTEEAELFEDYIKSPLILSNTFPTKIKLIKQQGEWRCTSYFDTGDIISDSFIIMEVFSEYFKEIEE